MIAARQSAFDGQGQRPAPPVGYFLAPKGIRTSTDLPYGCEVLLHSICRTLGFSDFGFDKARLS